MQKGTREVKHFKREKGKMPFPRNGARILGGVANLKIAPKGDNALGKKVVD